MHHDSMMFQYHDPENLDREYVGLFSSMFIRVLEGIIGIDNDMTQEEIDMDNNITIENDIVIIKMITAYPACINAHYIDSEFSAFAVCAQREDNTIQCRFTV